MGTEDCQMTAARYLHGSDPFTASSLSVFDTERALRWCTSVRGPFS